MFTKSQIKEVAELLRAASIKDSKFTVASALDGTEYIAILQDAKNRRLLLKQVFFYLQKHIDPAIVVSIQCVLDVLSVGIKQATDEIHELVKTEHAITREIVLDTKDDLTDSMKDVQSTIKQTEQSLTKTIGSTSASLIEKMDELDDNIVSGVSNKVIASVSDLIESSIDEKMQEYLDQLDNITNMENITTEEIDELMSGDDSSEEE